MVGFPAGGATDTTARLIASACKSRSGRHRRREYRRRRRSIAPSGRDSPADGYTLMMTTTGSFGAMPRLYKLDYDPVKAFVPVATLVVDKGVLVAGPSWPVKSVQEMVAQAKAAPGKFNYGSAIGIGPHFVFELFKRKAGADITHVPYRGGGPMITDLIGARPRHVTVSRCCASTSPPARCARSASARRRAGRHERRADADGVVLPRRALRHAVRHRRASGVPAAIVERLNAVINAGLRSAEMRAGLENSASSPTSPTPAEFAKLVAEEAPRWSEAVAITGIKVQ